MPMHFLTPGGGGRDRRAWRAGFDLDVYGLGSVRTLEQWLEYADLDYREGLVKTPWR